MLKVAGNIVTSIEVYNEEDYENIKSFKVNQDDNIQTLLETVYNYIIELKKSDRKFGYWDKFHYYIELETANDSFGPYKIVKLRNSNVYKIHRYTIPPR